MGPPPPALFEAMGEFAAEGARNGTLVDQGGLLPSEAGAIVSLADGSIKAVDGPFTEAKELVPRGKAACLRMFPDAIVGPHVTVRLPSEFYPCTEADTRIKG